jgi:hypothetical protein
MGSVSGLIMGKWIFSFVDTCYLGALSQRKASFLPFHGIAISLPLRRKVSRISICPPDVFTKESF